MLKLAVISNNNKVEIDSYKSEIISFLQNNDFIIEENPEIADVIVTLGGDGTILSTAHKFDKPILGINFGRVGFLAPFDYDDKESILKALTNVKIEERAMLDVGGDYALNDAVISRGAVSRIMYIDMKIDGEFVNRYVADGLIISTPTGSTAYSLSAGGSICPPDLDVFIVTPICPQPISARSMVVPGESIIEITTEEREKVKTNLTLDGQLTLEINNDKTIIKKSSKTAKFVMHPNKTYYEILRSKLR